MHISGSGRNVSAGLKDRMAAFTMQIPSSKRYQSKNGLPWKGPLGICILLSVSVNLLSLTLNKFQLTMLDELQGRRLSATSWDGRLEESFVPSVELDASLPGDVSEAFDFTDESRHLSSSSSSSSASVTGSSGSAAGSAHGGHHGPHPHDALLYLFNALCIGAGVMQLSAKYPILQQTIVLFVIGFIGSLILKNKYGGDEEFYNKLGVWGDSYKMWMGIDPHLLLFTLLPALLAGDAMTIDTSVAKRVGLQCLYLAGPGVLIGGFSTALFLFGYIQWESADDKKFLLSLCAGSILCATDPVVVVALLKELGASPMLTVQIQGESLLNDGTAIVLYLISYNMLTGKDYDWLDITAFLMEKAVMAFALGLFIGYFFFGWIRAVANKLDHSAGMIQITLTICCAYWAFIFVEGVLHLSGVLATVASSLVLAHHMWPYICSEESMHHVWHTIESLGNIIVFFLAGSITGWIVVDIEFADYLHLIVIYIVLLTIRSTLFFTSRPILQFLHADKLPVSWQDATLMTWGGLRGAVGLALAIQVNNDRAPDCSGSETANIHPKDAQRLLFFVSGVAFLTTLVNATTAPTLVHKLGITALPAARKTLLGMFHQQLVNWSEETDNPPEVTEELKHMLHHAAEELDHTQVSSDGPKSTRNIGGGHGHGHGHKKEEKQQFKGAFEQEAKFENNEDIVNRLTGLEEKYKKIMKSGPEEMQLLGGELPTNLLCRSFAEADLPEYLAASGSDRSKFAEEAQRTQEVNDMVTLIQNEQVDVGMAKVVNQCFLTLVYNNYWKQIEHGGLRPGSAESDVLLTSVRISLSPYRADLDDYKYVHEKMIGKEEVESDDVVGEEFGALAEDIPKDAPKDGCLPKVVNSVQFNIFIAVTILLNSIVVVVEELERPKDVTDGCGEVIKKATEDASVGWLIADGFFTAIFVVEYVLKFSWLKCSYYRDAWNRFDFALVVVGVFGLVMNIMTQGGGAELAGQTRVMRLARVLRTMRFLRVFRLFNAKLSADKFVSLELAKHMKKITTMSCFIRAHIEAQNDLVKYFGGNGKLDEVDESEIARCILQSQIVTYEAIIAAANTQKQIKPEILHELKSLFQRKTITEGLSHFVEKAHSDGAISATEAHAILHPLHHQVSACMKALNDRAEGVLDRQSSIKSEKGKHGHNKHGADEGVHPPAEVPAKEPSGGDPPQIGLASKPEAEPEAPTTEIPSTVGEKTD